MASGGNGDGCSGDTAEVGAKRAIRDGCAVSVGAEDEGLGERKRRR